ncbi:MAG: 7-cyano-7-deazaguanine synthase [Terricaulis sp.]
MKARALLLASGGLDSTTVAYRLHEAGVNFAPIFFDYGQHCVETEWDTLRRVLPPTAVAPERLNVSDIFRGSRSRLINEADPWTEAVADDDLYLPYRTLLFFALAAARAQTVEATEVYSGFINSNHAKEIDCSAAFLNSLDALAANVGPVRFLMPFREWSKAEVIAEAIRLRVPIPFTFSCQLMSDIPCGACPNCVERLNAMNVVRAAT